MPHRFVCFTDNPAELNPHIEIRLLPNTHPYNGWWWKPYVFKEGHFSTGDVNFFIDLDMVIVSNIDKFMDYCPGEFLGLEDVGRVFKRGGPRLGSAVLRWPANQFSTIYTTIENDFNLTRKFQGDQDLIWDLCKDSIKFYPADWIRSYKWEVRTQSELIRKGTSWVFKDVRNPEVHPDTAILAFHGTPNPHEVNDLIIVDNWQ